MAHRFKGIIQLKVKLNISIISDANENIETQQEEEQYIEFETPENDSCR